MGRALSETTYGSNGLDSLHNRGHCAVLLGKTFYSHSASLTQVPMSTGELKDRGNPSVG